MTYFTKCEEFKPTGIKFIHKRKHFCKENDKDNQKQRRWNKTECFWLQFGGTIMKFKGFTLISPSYSLFSSYTLAWHEMKASMKRANRRRWVDVVVRSQSVCFGLLCACVCVCACVHACVFECLSVCMCARALNQAWLWNPCSLSNTSHLPTAADSESKKDPP